MKEKRSFRIKNMARSNQMPWTDQITGIARLFLRSHLIVVPWYTAVFMIWSEWWWAIKPDIRLYRAADREQRIRIRSEIDGIRSETFTESHFLYEHGYENCLKVQKYLDYAFFSYLRKLYKKKSSRALHSIGLLDRGTSFLKPATEAREGWFLLVPC